MSPIQSILNSKTYQPNTLNELPTIEDKISDTLCDKYGFFYKFSNFLKTKKLTAEGNAEYSRNYYQENKKEILLKRKAAYKHKGKGPKRRDLRKELEDKGFKTENMSSGQRYYLANRDKRCKRTTEIRRENPDHHNKISRKYKETKKEICIFEEELEKVKLNAPQIVLDKYDDAFLEISLDLTKSLKGRDLVSSCNDVYKSKVKGVLPGDAISACLDKGGIIKKICINRDSMFNQLEFV